MKPLGVVTGVTSGIGRATAERLAADYRVIGSQAPTPTRWRGPWPG